MQTRSIRIRPAFLEVTERNNILPSQYLSQSVIRKKCLRVFAVNAKNKYFPRNRFVKMLFPRGRLGVVLYTAQAHRCGANSRSGQKNVQKFNNLDAIKW